MISPHNLRRAFRQSAVNCIIDALAAQIAIFARGLTLLL